MFYWRKSLIENNHKDRKTCPESNAGELAVKSASCGGLAFESEAACARNLKVNVSGRTRVFQYHWEIFSENTRETLILLLALQESAFKKFGVVKSKVRNSEIQDSQSKRWLIKRMSSEKSLLLPNGGRMPIIGFGTWQANEEELEAALDCALTIGYRHIDTAYVYRNERVVGKVLRKWLDAKKIKREDLFIVTKLPNIGNREAHVEKFLNLSLANLQLDYLDLYLIHTPFGLNYKDDETMIPLKPDNTVDLDYTTDLLTLWKKMEEQVDKGKTRAIGVSNFNKKQIEKILKVARIRPATNQVELHVYYQQWELQEYLKKENITLTAYSSLGTAGTVQFLQNFGVKKTLPNLLANPVVKEVAEEVKKSPAQVLLKFIVQRNIAVIPKSTNPERIKENFEIFDFDLSPDQMTRLTALDQKTRILRMEEFFKNVETHPEYPF